ncbi:MAG: hypothetical protein R3E64_16065 [Halioglobus sp.]
MPGEEASPPHQQSPGRHSREGDYIPASEVLDVERERIKVQDRRNDVMLAAIKANDDSDKRQHDFHMQRITDNHSIQVAKTKSATKLIWGLLGSACVFFSAMLYMLFFGDNSQSYLAMAALKLVLTAGGGAGVYVLVAKMVQRLYKTD